MQRQMNMFLKLLMNLNCNFFENIFTIDKSCQNGVVTLQREIKKWFNY